jgi:hypothetical protein
VSGRRASGSRAGPRVAGAALAFALTLLVVIAFIGAVLLRAAKPQDGEWSMRVGPWQHELSVPVMLRWVAGVNYLGRSTTTILAGGRRGSSDVGGA